jgi:hypothetical protein
MLLSVNLVSTYTNVYLACFMPSPSLAPLTLDPKVAVVVRACGRTLLLAFAVVILAASLPIKPVSLAWGTQFSGRIVDAVSLPLLGVALLRLATLLQPDPDSHSERKEALALARQKDMALLLCRLGMISLCLLAVWQIPLMFGSIATLEQQNLMRSGQLKQRISQGEQTIRQAPTALIQREWQRLKAAGAPGISPDISDPEQQRQLLLEQLEQQQQQLGSTIGNRDVQGRFFVVRNTLRILALCGVYIAGFQAIGKRGR